MSSLPGLDLEDFVAWAYDLIVEGHHDCNKSLAIAEAFGTASSVRPFISKERFDDLVAIFEPIREQVENLLINFDEETQSWRDYSQHFQDFIPDEMMDLAKKWMYANGFWA